MNKGTNASDILCTVFDS